MDRSVASKWLLWVSRVTFALSFLLAMMTPAWESGTFTLWPILSFSLSRLRFQVGILTLLPCVAATACFLAFVFERPRYPHGTTLYLIPLLLFCLLALVRIWPIHILHRAVVTVVAVALSVGVALYVLHDGHERWYTGVIAAMLFLQGGIAVVQFIRQESVGLYWMGEIALDPNGQGVSVVDVAGQRWLRAYGLTAHPNVLGGYLSLGILVCLGAARSVPKKMRRWLWGAIAVGSLGLFFTFSRSAWLGTVIGMLYLAWILRPWRAIDWHVAQTRRTTALLAGLLLAVAVVLGLVFRDLLLTRFLHLGSPLEATSIRERVQDIEQAWSLIRVVPLKGVGSGYYIDALWSQVGEDRPPGFRKIHNAYLLAAAELGVGGALLWLGTVLTPPIVVARRARQKRASRQPCIEGAGWAAAFLSGAIVCLFDSYLYIPSTWWPALFLGLLTGSWAYAVGAIQRRRE